MPMEISYICVALSSSPRLRVAVEHLERATEFEIVVNLYTFKFK